MGSQLRWLERTPDKREVDGSIPFEPTKSEFYIHFSTLKNIQIYQKGKLEELESNSKVEVENEKQYNLRMQKPQKIITQNEKNQNKASKHKILKNEYCEATELKIPEVYVCTLRKFLSEG